MHSEKVGAFRANRTEKVGAFRANKLKRGLYRGTYPYCFNMGVPTPGFYHWSLAMVIPLLRVKTRPVRR